MRVLIDADSLTYQAAFAVERSRYAVVREEMRGDQLEQTLLLADTDYEYAKQLEKEHTRPGDATVPSRVLLYKRTEVEPLENAVHALRSMLRTIREQIAERFGKTTDTELLLTGSGNFRDRLATVARYKFNRVERAKPQHYGQMRKYLVDECGAKIVHWYEADDEAAIALSERPDDTLVSSLDKDLLQVPGWHHIHGKGFLCVSEQSGLLRFYIQALMGDSTDGVPGCKGIGKAKAQSIVLKAAQSASSFKELERVIWRSILAAYRASLEKYGPDACGYGDPDTAALETARLVYLLRSRPVDPSKPELWEPK
jgi:hypothetical protein